MKARNEGSGLFGFLTALVTLYYTSVMMENLEVALGAYVGPSMAIILVTIFALFYQQRRSVKEFEQGGNYTMLEQTVTTLTDSGERVEPQRAPVDADNLLHRIRLLRPAARARHPQVPGGRHQGADGQGAD